jgi:peptidoglycan/xylan/chitin deacetylase (PgdA/CDA1 family)
MTGKLKRLLLAMAAGLLYYSGLLRLLHSLRRVFGRRREICVLGLHRVLSQGEEGRSNSLDGIVLKEATFAKLLEFLARRFSVISPDVLLENTPREPHDSKPWCLLTFDDGWRDNYTSAFPWLKKHAIPATIFLTTGMVGTRGGFWVEQLVRLWKDSAKRQQIQQEFRKAVPGRVEAPNLEEVVEYCKRMPNEGRRNFLRNLGLSADSSHDSDAADQMLTWDEIVEMSRDGIDFGSHTVSHPLLTYENDAKVEQELHSSKQTLEEKLAKKVKTFAYPNGDWDDRIRTMVKDSGYDLAFSVNRGWYFQGADRYTIPRIMLHEGNVTGPGGRFSPAILALRLSGWY